MASRIIKKRKGVQVKPVRKGPGRGKAINDADGVKKLTEFERYAFFLALPTHERKTVFGYKTDLAFAEENKVNKGTLSEWKWKPELWEAREKYMLHFKKFTADVLHSLAQRAIKKGYGYEAQVWLQGVEGLKQGVDLTSKGQRVRGIEFIVRNGSSNPDKKRTAPG
jgi:hypothetical protein